MYKFPRYVLSFGLGAVLLAAPLTAQTVAISGGGNYISGSGFYLGTHSGTPSGVVVTYDDSASDGVTVRANRIASWLWENYDGTTPWPSMRLDQSNNLILYNGSDEGVKLNPIAGSLKLGTHASGTLTADTNGKITAGGEFAVTGNFTSASGSLTGGDSGLTLNAGGTGQPILLNSSGGDLIFRANNMERARIKSYGSVGIGTPSPDTTLDVHGASASFRVFGTGTGDSPQIQLRNPAQIWQWKLDGADSNKLKLFDGGGINRWTVDTAGNVGIGTGSPLQKLSVVGGQLNVGSEGDFYGAWLAGGQAVDSYLGLGEWYSRAGYVKWFNAARRLALYTTANTEPLTLQENGGNVGIGTTSPGTTLDVQGIYASLRIFGTSPNDNAQLQLRNPGHIWQWKLDGADGNKLKLFDGGGTNRWTVDTAGNVGIGTTAPARPLVVVKDGADEVSSTFRGVAGFFNSVASKGLYVGYDSAEQMASLLPQGANSGISFWSHNGVSWGERMRVATNGNIGIGVTTPSHELAVNGTIQAREIVVTDTGWADYVFAEDYRLAPLAEVEAHIREKKHLPDIPSAAEVAEHGVSMGEMQAKLLAKVEELTLHLIAQEKRNNDQQKEITALREQVALLNRASVP